MCGIAGITGKQSERCDSRAAVERMASLISHCGPDESSIYEDEDVILGHARLSIIDLVGFRFVRSTSMALASYSLWLVTP